MGRWVAVFCIYFRVLFKWDVQILLCSKLKIIYKIYCFSRDVIYFLQLWIFENKINQSNLRGLVHDMHHNGPLHQVG